MITEFSKYKQEPEVKVGYYDNGQLEKLNEINSPHYEEQKFIYDAEEKYNL